MIPKYTQIDTSQAPMKLKLVGVQEAETKKTERIPLRPELRKAFEESWKRHESAYRYLGR